jgi:hypothetical protein
VKSEDFQKTQAVDALSSPSSIRIVVVLTRAIRNKKTEHSSSLDFGTPVDIRSLPLSAGEAHSRLKAGVKEAAGAEEKRSSMKVFCALNSRSV